MTTMIHALTFSNDMRFMKRERAIDPVELIFATVFSTALDWFGIST